MVFTNFFHSKELMQTYEHSSRHTPYMVVAFDDEEFPQAHMLVVRRNGKCRIYGEGEYREGVNREKIFDAMLSAFTRTISFPTLYIQISDLSRKMFAYKYLRRQHYFGIHWLQVHNSLHSKSPQERISAKQLRWVAYARKMKVSTTLVESEADLDDFYRVMRTYYNYHLRKFCPARNFFLNLMYSDSAKLFLTWYRGRPIAACAIICTQTSETDVPDGRDAYLWFGAYKTKSHPRLHPDVVTVWNVMNWCHSHKIRHLRFMDVGLPFFKNAYYDFIMRFGGKSVGTVRWFHFFPNILNALLRRIFH